MPSNGYFGLARGGDTATSGSDPNLSPTLTSAGSVAGTILGTAAYMSPEQARGQDIDRRSDIWSFGVIVMELLSGERLFQGDTAADTLAKVLREPIELAELPRDTPPALATLLARCLERDPRMRLRDIGEARVLLAGPLSGTPTQRRAGPDAN